MQNSEAREGNQAQWYHRPLESLVTDMLRPMLRERLDQLLPQIAERMIKEEIERLTQASPELGPAARIYYTSSATRCRQQSSGTNLTFDSHRM